MRFFRNGDQKGGESAADSDSTAGGKVRFDSISSGASSLSDDELPPSSSHKAHLSSESLEESVAQSPSVTGVRA